MKKKSLKGYLKTRHFLERQKQRKVTDLEVIQAITKGSLIENDYGHNFTHGNLKVTIDVINSVLITVHPGDPSTKATRIMRPEEAKKLLELIKSQELSKEEPDENEFLKYVSEFSVKKL